MKHSNPVKRTAAIIASVDIVNGHLSTGGHYHTLTHKEKKRETEEQEKEKTNKQQTNSVMYLLVVFVTMIPRFLASEPVRGDLCRLSC